MSMKHLLLLAKENQDKNKKEEKEINKKAEVVMRVCVRSPRINLECL